MELRMIKLVCTLLTMSTVYAATTLELTRFAEHDKADMHEVQVRDMARLARLKVLDFPVGGSADPFTFGLYYTTVRLGTPPQQFNLQIDTGSDISWLNCKPCNNCTEAVNFDAGFHYFDATASTTASLATCPGQPTCASVYNLTTIGCLTPTNSCKYGVEYADGSSTEGFYITEVLTVNTIDPIIGSVDITIPVYFGCSISQPTFFMMQLKGIDGILALGPNKPSIAVQFSSQGITSAAFGHCFRGDGTGGLLVFGEIIESTLTYTPIIPSEDHYSVRMDNIIVNGASLPLEASIFTQYTTVIDSGTRFTYLFAEAFDAFVAAVNSLALKSTSSYSSQDHCYSLSTSVTKVFPEVRLTFSGGAFLILGPQDYLLERNSFIQNATWCLAFRRSTNVNILGDIVLKDKLVEYDWGRKRIGMTNYDCSRPLNVSTVPIASGSYQDVLPMKLLTFLGAALAARLI